MLKIKKEIKIIASLLILIMLMQIILPIVPMEVLAEAKEEPSETITRNYEGMYQKNKIIVLLQRGQEMIEQLEYLEAER